jgi:hypothetical protein
MLFDENPRRNSLKLKHKIAMAVALVRYAASSAQLHVPRPTRLNLCRESLDRAAVTAMIDARRFQRLPHRLGLELSTLSL